MNSVQMMEAAKLLYHEHKANYGFMPKGEQRNFVARVRRLAKKVSRLCVSRKDQDGLLGLHYDPDEVSANMYLDNLATRLGIEIKYKEDL